MGRHRRCRRDRVRRARTHRAPSVALRARDRRPGARPADAAAARRARVRARLLAAHARAGHVARHAPFVARPRLRAAAGDARLHRPRDGRQPGGGGAPPGRRPAALGLRRHRDGRDDLRRDRGRRALGLPRPRHRARVDVDPRADARRRRQHPRGAAVLARQPAAVLRRCHRRADPARGGDDVDLGLLPARVLTRRARPAPAQLRPAEPPCPRLSARDRLRRGDLLRDRDRDGVLPPRRAVPREPLLLRRPAGVHRRAARRDQAAGRRARPAAALSRSAEHPDPRGGDPAAGDRRLDPHLHDLGARARDAPGRTLRRAGVARDRPRRLHRGADLARRGADGEGDRRRRAAHGDGAARPQDPRADEAGRDRRGDARHRDQARPPSTTPRSRPCT